METPARSSKRPHFFAVQPNAVSLLDHRGAFTLYLVCHACLSLMEGSASSAFAGGHTSVSCEKSDQSFNSKAPAFNCHVEPRADWGAPSPVFP